MLSTATLNAADLFRCGVTRASTGCRVSTIERHCVELINGNLRDRRRGSILEPTLRVLSLLTFLSLSLSLDIFSTMELSTKKLDPWGKKTRKGRIERTDGIGMK